MCGIIGFISTEEGIPHNMLIAMRDALLHRGPDDAGIKLFNAVDGRQNIAVGLAHGD